MEEARVNERSQPSNSLLAPLESLPKETGILQLSAEDSIKHSPYCTPAMSSLVVWRLLVKHRKTAFHLASNDKKRFALVVKGRVFRIG